MTINQFVDKQTIYVQTIKDAYPSLDILSARLHNSDGQFNNILFINDDLIFRFPRYAEVMDGFLQEVELLQKLQGRLSLPIPNPIYVSENSRTIETVFMGYRMIQGEPLLRDVLNAIKAVPRSVTPDQIRKYEAFALSRGAMR